MKLYFNLICNFLKKDPIFGINILEVCILIFSPHFFLLQLEMEQDDVIEVYQEQTGGFYRS